MRRFVEGANRSQLTLLPECLEDLVSKDKSVYVIDVFVEALDFHGMGFERGIAKNTGRPSDNLAVLLKLYICGYLNRVRSEQVR
jgi:transposase